MSASAGQSSFVGVTYEGNRNGLSVIDFEFPANATAAPVCDHHFHPVTFSSTCGSTAGERCCHCGSYRFLAALASSRPCGKHQ